MVTTMMAPTTTFSESLESGRAGIRVVDFLGDEPSALGPEQAPPVAEAVLDALKHGEVELTFAGVQGVTTAFTNNLLLLIFSDYSFGDLRGRLHFRFSSRLQRDVLVRSMTALKELKSSP